MLEICGNEESWVELILKDDVEGLKRVITPENVHDLVHVAVESDQMCRCCAHFRADFRRTKAVSALGFAIERNKNKAIQYLLELEYLDVSAPCVGNMRPLEAAIFTHSVNRNNALIELLPLLLQKGGAKTIGNTVISSCGEYHNHVFSYMNRSKVEEGCWRTVYNYYKMQSEREDMCVWYLRTFLPKDLLRHILKMLRQRRIPKDEMVFWKFALVK